MTNFNFRRQVRAQKDTAWLITSDIANATNELGFWTPSQARIVRGELFKRKAAGDPAFAEIEAAFAEITF